jgi:hypothetical protein
VARIRTIKPDFFTSEDITALSPMARLLYIALWCEADKEGRMVWKPKTFKLRYLPADNCDAEALCAEIVSQGLVVLYGDGLAYIPAFAAHQHINPRETPSSLPTPDASPTRRHASARVPDAQGGREGKGKEGKGKEYEGQAGEAVPYQAIVDAYHAALPACQRWVTLTDERKRLLGKAAVNARRICQSQGWTYGPDFWTDFFAECAKDPWMRGDLPNPKNPNWKQSLDVLLRDKQFAQVMDRALGEGA